MHIATGYQASDGERAELARRFKHTTRAHRAARTACADPNPVVKRTALRTYPDWVVREYRDGTFDAVDVSPGGVGLAPVSETFADAVRWVRLHG